ncbi:transcription termination factor Rho [Nocardioides sp. Iso805N]|uniref:transcription termination factor Rho n=1 Tax=Nocardioides sp. Iso805N TaxID=1283287 RepID=UPI00035C8E50|nr:transcription termination factor Rho [Nocardioides sp. Iso805N]
MTETIESTDAAPKKAAPKKAAAGGLNSMLLADLKAMASGMGIAGSGAMKKAQLVEAIKDAQSSRPTQRVTQRPARTKAEKVQQTAPPEQGQAEQRQAEQRQAEQSVQAEQAAPEKPARTRAARGAKANQTPPAEAAAPVTNTTSEASAEGETRPRRERQRKPKADAETPAVSENRSEAKAQQHGAQQAQDDAQHEDGQQRERQPRQSQGNQGQNRTGSDRNSDRNSDHAANTNTANANAGSANNAANASNDPDGDGSRRNRRRRGRDRDRNRPVGAVRGDIDTEIRDDDVLVPAAGILDVLDNYAFVRTSGYLPGPEDVYVSLSMVRKLGLRRGDAIVGQVRQPREGERKEKFNPMVKIDSVNGTDPTQSPNRVEFSKLTPLYASERLRMETDATNLIGRVIDIAAPIGKGQRGLIVSPAKAGKTMIMQSIANSITINNPECHLMVVLVDERPEEVTDFQRSVKGEVISSTFDRPASDHTIVAELAIERAKRLVELGHDVVVLLDGITRLGRAYNLAAPASGRILSGGVDSAALYPPKRFFGAARNIENGGSLTILATALIESGSKMDEVIFEEFKGTGNMEIRLRRDFAEKRIFPAIDAIQSGTRREELLVSKEELAIIWKLRRVLSALDGQQALELLLERLKKTHSNVEFLMQVQKTTPGPDGD